MEDPLHYKTHCKKYLQVPEAVQDNPGYLLNQIVEYHMGGVGRIFLDTHLEDNALLCSQEVTKDKLIMLLIEWYGTDRMVP